MIKYLIIAIGVLYFNNISAQKTNMQLIQDSNYVLLPYHIYDTWIFKNATSTGTIETNEFKILQKLLYKAINTYNKKKNSYDKINVEKYKFQFVPAINEKKEKEVWINGFCRTNNMDWKKNIVQIDDGGKCYFSFKINLATKKYYDFIVNGHA